MSVLDDLFAGLTPATAATTTVATQLAVPKLALPLKDFQEEAVEHALRDTANHGYAYLALDMGLGKTPCGLAIAAASVAAGQRPVLVVVPPSLRINWKREAAKFTPWLTVETIQGTRPEAGVSSLPDADVLIIGSSSLMPAKATKADIAAGIKAPIGWYDLMKGNIKGFIVDEAHFFKNKSGRTKALRDIASTTTGIRVLMSGTPTPNGRHEELANQIHMLGRKAWNDIGGEGVFWTRYAPQHSSGYGRTSDQSVALYEAMTASWYFRRLRGDVIELPNKGRSMLAIEGRGAAVSAYKRAEKDLISWLKSEGKDARGAARAEALVKLTTLRRLAGEAKVQAVVSHVKDLLDEESGGVFVVAEHRNVMDGLLLGLSSHHPTSIEGGMSDKEKQWNIDEFTSGRSRVLVGQIVAAGVGLTLHGDGRNRREVVVQLPWTPAALMQVEDRLHRIGQTKDVEIEVCLAAIEGTLTIDERLWAMLEAKAFSASSITDGEGQFLLEEVQGELLDSYR